MPISTKLGRNDAWENEIQICSNEGAGPFLDPKRDKIRKILIQIKISSFHEPLAGMH